MANQQQQAQALGDPTRFAIFEHIRTAEAPVAIADLVDLLGFNHNAIRQHLAKLLEAELLVETTEKRTTRGRPRRFYEARDDALDAFAGAVGSYEWLSQRLLELHESGGTPYEVGRRAGAAAGVSAEASTGAAQASVDDIELLRAMLIRGGFDPSEATGEVPHSEVPAGESAVTLGRCPFAHVAAKSPAIVCELHRGLIDGHLGGESPRAELDIADPFAGGCVVRVSLGDTNTAGR